jgi:hypothetical protein
MPAEITQSGCKGSNYSANFCTKYDLMFIFYTLVGHLGKNSYFWPLKKF